MLVSKRKIRIEQSDFRTSIGVYGVSIGIKADEETSVKMRPS